ncbi:unnamed protein product [Tuber melanosporum]|uniref:(Perigord truffle) hypothetical protein n=1 Tax=Tuber melanosporum (strain Mel28) TaxID=656061 RepID=D5G9A0_TUBMM|nr:uncharacterized protein GSTUM_00003212001 [Tuber melanosporum]CAZ81093.1 unnamed protein product [Tuber melanosporum]
MFISYPLHSSMGGTAAHARILFLEGLSYGGAKFRRLIQQQTQSQCFFAFFFLLFQPLFSSA